jgi:hypothetical protein
MMKYYLDTEEGKKVLPSSQFIKWRTRENKQVDEYQSRDVATASIGPPPPLPPGRGDFMLAQLVLAWSHGGASFKNMLCGKEKREAWRARAVLLLHPVGVLSV